MRVRIRLFARLRDLVGTGELIREVAPGATVAAVWAALADEFPSLAAYSSSISGAVNAEYAPMTRPVSDGDEVAFLPPVSGGAGGCVGSSAACETPRGQRSVPETLCP